MSRKDVVRVDPDAPKPPPYGTGRPAGEGPVPRVVDPLDRATPGLARFKISVRDLESAAVKYVLVKQSDKAEAEAVELVKKAMDRAKGFEFIPTALPD